MSFELTPKHSSGFIDFIDWYIADLQPLSSLVPWTLVKKWPEDNGKLECQLGVTYTASAIFLPAQKCTWWTEGSHPQPTRHDPHVEAGRGAGLQQSCRCSGPGETARALACDAAHCATRRPFLPKDPAFPSPPRAQHSRPWGWRLCPHAQCGPLSLARSASAASSSLSQSQIAAYRCEGLVMYTCVMVTGNVSTLPPGLVAFQMWWGCYAVRRS